MTEDPGPAPPGRASCANCGTPLRGRFCSACGQEDRDPARVSVGELVSDWLGDVFTFDSRLFRTLGPLVRKPGFLTREYLAGRRMRYVPPLRLFIFISLIMFLVMGLTGVRFSWQVTSGDKVLATPDRAQETSTEAAAEPAESAGRSWVQKDPDEINRRLFDRSPQVMFVLAPLFAFYVWLLERRRSPFYMSHLIFSLHVHGFWFLAFIAAALLDAPFREHQPGKLLLFLTLAPYLYFALRRAYGGGRIANLMRTLALGVAQVVSLGAAMLALLFLTVWLG